MELSYSPQKNDFISRAKRFLTLDITRGIVIVGMLVLHIISDALDVDTLLADINSIPLINLFALVLLPFFGGLAGLFLLISSVGNMISFYRELKKGNSVKGIVFKQIISGVVLLAFAMIIEGITGYHGIFGEIFKHLNDTSAINTTVPLWRWNYLETIHTIAWCLIINGCVQGLLSLKGNWKNTKRLIISYIILAVGVIGLTQLVWFLVGLAIPGYPFSSYPNGHRIYMPWIGTEPFWHIFRAPFITPLAAEWEPIFPYLAVSFIGSIIGIVLSQPKEKISNKFPRRMFLVGTVMFVGGLVGIIIVLLQIIGGTYSSGVDPFDVAIAFYQTITNHRFWSNDAANLIFAGETVPVPRFSWVAQFLALNGLSIMILMFLFRMIEFRGKGNSYAKRTKIIRRFGTVALTNYNNQWIYFLIFFLVSLLITQGNYLRVMWSGTFLIIFLTLGVFILLLWAWEKIGYLGSMEWIIRTFTNNVVPVRRKSFAEGTKWWKRAQIDVQRRFYNVNWINLADTQSEVIDVTKADEPERKESIDEALVAEIEKPEKKDSKLALILSIVGVFSILFILISIIGLVVSLEARKNEGNNKMNLAALVLSIIGCVLILGFIITTLVLPIGALGLF